MKDFSDENLERLAKEWHCESGSLSDDPRNTIPALVRELLKANKAIARFEDALAEFGDDSPLASQLREALRERQAS